MSTAERLAPPPAKKPMAPPPPNGAPSISKPVNRVFEVQSGRCVAAQKVVVYGPGGVGKTELCSNIAQCGMKPLFVDIGDSSRFLNVNRIMPANWDELRGAVQCEWKEFDTIVIDDFTKAEEMAKGWTIANVKHEKENKTIRSIEDYGFGKGMTHVYETFLQLLGDLDALIRRGKFVICTAHECTAKVPNPAGEDWIRYEPRLQSPESGKNSIRHRVKEWCDHLLFVGYDVAVEDGRGIGAGTRAIYPCELPICMAKSRDLSQVIKYEKGSADLWNQLLHKE